MPKISPTSRSTTLALTLVAMLATAAPALAQSDDADPEMRVQQLENQLRQLTGQNEELQYRNRQLEERLRMLQGGAQAAPSGQPAIAQQGVVTQPGIAQPVITPAPAAQPDPTRRQPGREQPAYDEQQIAAPAPIIQAPEEAPQGQRRRRGDAFDPSQNPNAPGAPRALGGGQLPIATEAPVGAPGGRGPGEPLDLANTGVGGTPSAAMPPLAARAPAAGPSVATLPPSATPK